MPLYEFECKKCKEIFEKLTDMGTEEFKCPFCGTISKKSNGSYLFAAHGTPNGHIGARTSKDTVNKKLDTALNNFK